MALYPNIKESLTDCGVKLQSFYDCLSLVKNQFKTVKLFTNEIPEFKDEIVSLKKKTEVINFDLLGLVSLCDTMKKNKYSFDRYSGHHENLYSYEKPTMQNEILVIPFTEDLYTEINISQDSTMVISQDSSMVISQDSSMVISQDSSMVISQDGTMLKHSIEIEEKENKVNSPNQISESESPVYTLPTQEISLTDKKFLLVKESDTLSEWDMQFVKLRSELLVSDQLEDDILEVSSQLEDHFLAAAATFSKMIIGERHIDVMHKKIRPSDVRGVAGGSKFLIHDLFFKYPVDTEIGRGWLYGGINENNIYAAKATNHDLNGITYCMEADKENKINYPLTGIIDYQGFRLTVMTHLPISTKSLVYGSDDAGETLHADNEVHKILLNIGFNLNLREHGVRGHIIQKMALCGDIEIHRLKHLEKEYLFGLDLARVFPPVVPCPGATSGSIFFRLLRPELVKKMREKIKHGLASDALSNWLGPNQSEMNGDIQIASNFLLEQVDNFAIELSDHKFNERLVNMAFKLAKQPSFSGIPLKDNIIRELHKRGINMRYIGLLAIKIDGNDKMKNFLICLMVTRVMKNMWRKNIQKQTSKRVHEMCLFETLKILNSFVNCVNANSAQEKQGKIFWKEICIYMVEMFEKGLTNDRGKLKEMLITTKSKSQLDTPWVIIRFCQLCGIALTPNAIKSLHEGFPFQFSRADILDFVVNIKCLPILHYITGIYNFKKAKKENIIGTKLSLMKAASERLLNALNYDFPSVREYYAKSQFFSQKFDRKFAGDWYEIKQYYDQKWKQLSNNNVNTEITQKYLDCLCFTLWPVFLLQLNSEYTQIELNELGHSNDETINNLKSILSNTQIVEIVHCITNFQKMLGAMDKKIEDSIRGLTLINIIQSDNNPLIKKFIEEIMYWDIEIDRKWWFFARFFSSPKDVLKFCHREGIKLKDRNSEEFPVLPYPHLLSLFYYGDMELEQMLDKINVSDLKLTEILSIVNEVDGPNLAVAKRREYKDVVDLLTKRGVKLNIPVVICDSIKKIIENLEDFNKEKATMKITSMRELNFSDIKIGDEIGIGDEGAKSLSSALMSNDTLTSLNLSLNKIGDEGAKSLSYALMSNNTLTSLNFSKNKFGVEGVNNLSSGLKSNHSLTYLNLSSNVINIEGANYLSSALKSNNTLTFLDLSYNRIGVEGANSLSSSLESNNTLTSLNIKNNSIGKEGTKSLSSALKSNKTLTFLDLTCNKIGDEGAKSLSSALMLNKTLTSLNFSINGIGDEGANSLSYALRSNNTLTSLNIKSNKIGDEGAKSLSSALMLTNRTLTFLDLGSNQIGREVANSLSSDLKLSNNTLTFLT